MNDLAVRVEGISKLYRIGERKRHTTLRDALAAAAVAPFRRFHPAPDDRSLVSAQSQPRVSDRLWALRDVSFEVRRGEVLGIVGANGAGKSTLLKILSRITEPTWGCAEIHGRLGSLLEVGTGFHSELTGRENIFLNGAILGMKKTEIKRRFDEIVEFSEVERFIDTPVKRYSSGMYMRLAFAVAAHLEPDILMVDEVLAVGDASFQRKCMGKMGNVAQTGRTVLFVSHNLLAMEDLCDRIIWLQDGCIVDEGQPSSVIHNYLKASFATDTEKRWTDMTTAPGNEDVRLHRVAIRPAGGSSSDPITVRNPVEMEFEYWKLRADTHLSLSLALYNEQGVVVFTTGPAFDPYWAEHKPPAGLYRNVCRVPGDLLNDGMYRVAVYIDKSERTILQEDDALVFNVSDTPEMRHGWHGKWVGAIRPMLNWSTELVETVQDARTL